MELTGRFKFLGTEKGKTREGKEFTRLGLLQGLNSEVMYVNDDIITKVEKLSVMTEVNCLLQINVRDDRTAYVGIKDIFPVVK